MHGPNEELRAEIYNRLVELPNVEDGNRVVSEDVESRLDEILNRVRTEANDDIETSDVLPRIRNRLETGRIAGDEIEQHTMESEQVLAAVDQWSSVASYASAWVYAPQSPFPRNLAGWASKVAETLRKIVNLLLTPLQVAAKALGAVQWSIGASFPWGVSVSLTWQ